MHRSRLSRRLSLAVAAFLALGVVRTHGQIIDQYVNGKASVPAVVGLYDASATFVTLASGAGAKLPTPPFNCGWANTTLYPDAISDPNYEIVRVTAKSGDIMTVLRNQEGLGAFTHNFAGTYQFLCVPTAKFANDIRTEMTTPRPPLYGGTGVAGTITGIPYANGTSPYTAIATPTQLGTALGSVAANQVMRSPDGSAGTMYPGGIVPGDLPTGIQEYAVSGAMTLAWGASYVASCTGSSYALTIPTVSGQPNATIAVRITDTSSCLVRLQGTSGQNINQGSFRLMWAGESALLKSDLVQSNKLEGTRLPMVCTLSTTFPLNQTIPTGTNTKIAFDTVIADNTGLMADTTNHRCTPPRGGLWDMQVSTLWASFSASSARVFTTVQLTGGTAFPAAMEFATASGGTPRQSAVVFGWPLATTDYLEGVVFQNSGSDAVLLYATMSLREVNSW